MDRLFRKRYLCLMIVVGTAFIPGAKAMAEQAAAERRITLDECVQAALTNLAAARNRHSVERAASSVSVAKAQLGPSFGAVARVNTQSTNQSLTVADSQEAFLGERARVGLTVRLPLYDGGRRVAQLRVAQAGLSESLYGAHQTERDVRLGVTEAYYGVLRSQRLLETADLNVRAAQEHLRDAQTRFDVGAVTKGDILSAQSVQASENARRESRIAELAAARAHLAVMMGEDPMRVVPAVAEPAAPPAGVVPTQDLFALAQRYDLERRRLVETRKGERAGLSVIRADRSPQIDLRGSAGYLVQDNSGSRDYEGVSLELRLPLFDGPRVRAREANQVAQLQLRDLELQQRDREIQERVVVTQARYRAVTARVAASEEGLAAATEAHRLAQERYQVGKGTETGVLEALIRLGTAREDLVDAVTERDVLAYTVRLLTTPQSGVGIPKSVKTDLYPAEGKGR